MKNKVTIKVSASLLEQIKNNIKSQNISAKVGWFNEDRMRSDGEDNNLIVSRHIYGSQTLGIPRRDPIYAPFKREKEAIAQHFANGMNPTQNIKTEMMNSLEKTAFYVKEAVIMNEILTEGQGSWTKLSDKTIVQKGHNKMLIDTKEMVDKLKFKIIEE